MFSFVTQVSKYVMILLMILYTINSFRTVRIKKNVEDEKRISLISLLCVYFIYLFGYLVVFANSMTVTRLIIGGMILLYLIVYPSLFFHLYPRGNRMLMSHMLLFLVLGILMLFRLSPSLFDRQIVFITGASIVTIWIPFFVDRLKSAKIPAAIAGVLGLMTLVFVWLFGNTSFGANLSISLKGISIQPSEFVKITFVLLIAMLFRKRDDFKRIVFATCVAAAHVLVLVLSRDLGAALIFFICYLTMLLTAVRKPAYPLVGVGLGAIGSVAAYFMFGHVRTRVAAWINPWSIIDDQGYQITQSLFAIGYGGFFGKGFYMGSPNKVPVVAKDFIFSAFAEEMGGLFCICLIFAILSCLLMMIRSCARMKTMFYKLVGIGFVTVYGTQVFLTIAGAMKMIPSTGVTLPFISYGGSSLSAMFIIFMILQGLNIMRDREEITKTEEEVKAAPEGATAVSYTPVCLKDGRVALMPVTVPEPATVPERSGEETDREADPEIYETKDSKVTKRNKEVFFIAYMFIILFFAMSGYYVWFLISDGEQIQNNMYNSRTQLMEMETVRGDIYSSDGEVLAHSYIDNSGNVVREYPKGTEYAHVVGYVNNGGLGVERNYKYEMLSSHTGIKEAFLNEFTGKKLMGDNLWLSLDSSLQELANEALGEDTRGAVLAMEPSTGRILCMVSKPDFDPGSIDENWDEIINEKADTGLLVNRSTQGLYPPGSTFKLLTTLEYFRETENFNDEIIYNCNGEYYCGDNIIHCSEGMAHGEVRLSNGLAFSCNGVFADIGKELDPVRFTKLCNDFGYNRNEFAKMDISTSSFLLTNESSDWLKMQTSIGQGNTLATPLEMLMTVSCIANKGSMMKPYVVDRVVNRDGDVITEFTPEEMATPMTVPEAEWMTSMMVNVVDNGTAFKSKPENATYSVAGKTGSPQYETKNENTHAIYVGFAPADDPKIAVVVVIEEGGSGGNVAAPVAARLFENYLSEDR